MGGVPDVRRLGDEELRELIAQAGVEWESRVKAAFRYRRAHLYRRARDADPDAVAAAILRRGGLD